MTSDRLTPREEFEVAFGKIADEQWQWVKEFAVRQLVREREPLLEDEDGAPYPEVWAVFDPKGDPRLYLPYPGSMGTGSHRAAVHVVAPNLNLGLLPVRCQLVPVRTGVEYGELPEGG